VVVRRRQDVWAKQDIGIEDQMLEMLTELNTKLPTSGMEDHGALSKRNILMFPFRAAKTGMTEDSRFKRAQIVIISALPNVRSTLAQYIQL
jgi:hypothetical protein